MDENLKAAYALNLCTVSVSQIVDYDDEFILEQEYENVLNNINLQNIPKDSSLRKILIEILNTITFFRIQKIEKEKIELRYQQRVRNKLWSAVPSFGSLFAGGIIPMAVSLATQLGTGYMNYRREKASILLDREMDELSLRITLVEQLNALRRELFSTAWDLASTHEYNDSYRLSESQIKQYNAILCDSDPVRRYERLTSFESLINPDEKKPYPYPPLYYYIGNAANEVFQNNPRNYSDSQKKDYYNIAKENYRKFLGFESAYLLRVDSIMAAGALEYAELLMAEDYSSNMGEIIKALKTAEKHAGTSLDVLQLCAVTYMRIFYAQPGNETALSMSISLLKRLINEGYDRYTNAQLLNGLYLYVYTKHNQCSLHDTVCVDMHNLGYAISPEYLVLPESISGNELNEAESQKSFLETELIKKQQALLKKKTVLVVREFIKKYTIAYNRIIPAANVNVEYPDSYFLDEDNCRYIRLNDIERVLMTSEADYYLARLRETVFPREVLSLLNKLHSSIREMEDLIDDSTEAKLRKSVISAIEAQSDTLSDLQEKLEGTPGNFSKHDFATLFNITFGDFTRAYFEILREALRAKINWMKEPIQFDNADACLQRLCSIEGIPTPEYLLEHSVKSKEESPAKVYFKYELLGDRIRESVETVDKKKSMEELFSKYENEIILDPDKAEIILGSENTFARCASTNPLKDVLKEQSTHPIALLKLKNRITADYYLFTDKEIICCSTNPLKKSAKRVGYGDIGWENLNTIRIGDEKLSSQGINLDRFAKLLEELAQL